MTLEFLSDPTLLIVRNKRKTLTKSLLPDNPIWIGCEDVSSGWHPDIDLSQDEKVSKKHAQITFKNNGWCLKNCQSQHETLVSGQVLRADESFQLNSGLPIKIGDSFIIPGWEKYYWQMSENFFLGLNITPAVNYAIYHCGFPIISDLAFINISSDKISVNLSLEISGYSDAWQKELSLDPGVCFYLKKIPLLLHYEKLQGLEGKCHAQILIKINKEPLLNIPINILGFYEWSFDPLCRKSLACFVQPAHPVIQSIVYEALSALKNNNTDFTIHPYPILPADNRSERILSTIYNCLKDCYHIQYDLNAPSYETTSQVIRPPHIVIQDLDKKIGRATCIDLALFLAACLENLNLQPLIIVIRSENSGYQHALLGCWQKVEPRVEPLITDYNRIVDLLESDQLILLEVTGLTDRWGEKLSYDQAVTTAGEIVTKESFLFMLDIAATRQTVSPLQFPFEPGIMDVFRRAEVICRQENNSKLETKHLLASLINTNKKTRDILQKAGSPLSSFNFKFDKNKQTQSINPQPTFNYRRVIEDARIIATDTRALFVNKDHLFDAILRSQSKNVDHILENELSVTRNAVISVCDQIFGWKNIIVETIYEI